MNDGLAEVVALVEEPGARLLRAWTLIGGLSATMTVVEVERPDGSRRRLVVRRARTSQSERASLCIADEFRLLVELRALGLPVPQPRGVDDSGTILDQPYSVLDYVDGSPRFAADDPGGTGRVFAAQLAAIHQIDGSRSDFADFPRQTEVIRRRLAETGNDFDVSLSEGVIHEVLCAHWPPPEPHRPSLLHGDFWPVAMFSGRTMRWWRSSTGRTLRWAIVSPRRHHSARPLVGLRTASDVDVHRRVLLVEVSRSGQPAVVGPRCRPAPSWRHVELGRRLGRSRSTRRHRSNDARSPAVVCRTGARRPRKDVSRYALSGTCAPHSQADDTAARWRLPSWIMSTKCRDRVQRG